ncbi:glycosyl transferase [Bradyrhizobium macuxiense]|uniref:Glycosyl transferase n=1 Tax=Bradyrhizobium macuxiense TaxID=1755647 RepID=A0A120FNV5_9BRAD|nr:WecB/TagA/CpsF family glycosyltransferase [Bradyrhizobium macuxiense]KWV55984.1 glycosyl transferase [Bradyrhizobium macuxiense]
MSAAVHPRNDCGDVLGVKVSAVTMEDAVVTIERWISERRREYVCVTDVHCIMQCRRDPALRKIYDRAGMVTPDGVPVVYFLRLTGKTRTQRVYGPDLMQAMSAVSEKRGYRQFYYGGNVGVADKLKERLVSFWPGLQVVGTICPPFRQMTPAEDQAAVDAINAARPDIVWVGLGAPKQERWMAEHLDRIEAPVMIGVGAAFDFLAGTKRQAPKWMQRHALEWLFRLCSEPRRLWRRYAYVVPGFAFLAVGEISRRVVRSWGLGRRAPLREHH